MSVMNNAVENGIGKSGVADDFMPVLDRHLNQGAPIELSKSVSDGERCGGPGSSGRRRVSKEEVK